MRLIIGKAEQTLSNLRALLPELWSNCYQGSHKVRDNYYQGYLKVRDNCYQRSLKVRDNCYQGSHKVRDNCYQRSLKDRDNCYQGSLKVRDNCYQRSLKVRDNCYLGSHKVREGALHRNDCSSSSHFFNIVQIAFSYFYSYIFMQPAPKTAKFGPKYAVLVILGQILAFLAHFVPCPTKLLREQGA